MNVILFKKWEKKQSISCYISHTAVMKINRFSGTNLLSLGHLRT